MAGAAAIKYASALFELADESDIERLGDEAETVIAVLEENPEFIELLSHPGINHLQKREVIETVFAGFSEEMRGFIILVVSKKRAVELSEMLRAFIGMFDERAGILQGEAVSATHLNDESIEKITQIISEKTGKMVKLTARADSGLIGGLYIEVGGFVFDGSIRKRLADMKAALYSIEGN